MPDTPPSIVDEPNFYPPWAPRVWSGMRVSEFQELLSECNNQIHWSRFPMLGMVSMTSVINSGWSLLQRLTKQSSIASTEIEKPPVFIVGHWRSGTTLTHELMSLDQNLAFPSNYDAFVPSHFLVSAAIVKWPVKMLLPKQRPFDNMSIDVDYPQEDDFALMTMGAPSYYRRFGFPDQQDSFIELLDSENLSGEQRQRLAECISLFYKSLTYRCGRQLVLKSPPHTARIRLLLELFPNAKFVHISRHPYKVVPSTMRLWAISDKIHGFHAPRYKDAELMQHIVRAKSVMYDAYRRDRSLLAENQLAEISFESLLANPAQTIENVYGQLELSGAGEVIDSTKKYFEDRKGHKQNKHSYDHLREQIASDWSDYMQMFKYE